VDSKTHCEKFFAVTPSVWAWSAFVHITSISEFFSPQCSTRILCEHSRNKHNLCLFVYQL
jgi:hypothetical protein